MLDGIGRGKRSEPVVPPVKKKVRIPSADKRKFIDSFRIRRTQKIRVASGQTASVRVEVAKSPRWMARKKRSFLFGVILLALLAFLCGLGIQSKPYKALVLFSKIKNESIILGFQNSAELRPTGGFWGSFALLKSRKSLTDSEILFETNPYKNDNPLLKTSTAELPAPMKETWPDRPQTFVNANWSLDFEEAGKTLEYYFGQGWNESANGVVGVSSLAVIDLLRLTGPVTANDGTEINADNFTEVMSQKIDTEYWQSEENKVTNEPKDILKKLAPDIVNRTKKLSEITLYRFVLDQMNKGHIVAYFNDAKKQELAEDLEISGRLLPYSVDYLSVNNANLNGGKSSLNIKQKISYVVLNKAAAGTVPEWGLSPGRDSVDRSTATLKITRSYPDHAWPDILNRNYTRVVAPLGSKLVSAKLDDTDILSEVETLDESGRTTFGFWFSVAPAEAKTAVLEYELPFALKSPRNYNLILQKQPGTLADEVSINAFDQNLFTGLLDQNSARF